MNAIVTFDRTSDMEDVVQRAALSAVDSGDVPGVVARVWHRGRLRCDITAGMRDVERAVPMDRSTIFGIASMSKPVTVALALMLVDEGKVALDDPIARWAPEFAQMRVLRQPDSPLDDTVPAERPITIEDLMTHRSGLAYGFLTPPPLGTALMSRVGMGLAGDVSPDAWMQTLADLPLVYRPGERFNYGMSIDVLGMVVARVLDMDLRSAMRQRLLLPLGMVDTDFWVAPAKRDRLAPFYVSGQAGEFTGASSDTLTTDQPPACPLGGQGLVSTADDYLRFARMLMHDGELDGVRVLKAETVRQMRGNRYSAAQRRHPYFGQPFTQGMGLGVWVTTDATQAGAMGSAGSFGWPGAFGGWWLADPREDLVLLWLQQCAPSPPKPGAALPRIPGMAGLRQFRQSVYESIHAEA